MLFAFIILLALCALIELYLKNYVLAEMAQSLIYYLVGLITIISFYNVNYHFRLQNTHNKIPLSKIDPKVRDYQIDIIKLIEGKSIEINKNAIENVNNIQITKAVLFFLGTYDDIAVGVLEGVLDEKLVRKLQGNFMVKLYQCLKPYIEELKAQKNPATYTGLELLMKKWGERRYEWTT
jgi:hypothetical protein